MTKEPQKKRRSSVAKMFQEASKLDHASEASPLLSQDPSLEDNTPEEGQVHEVELFGDLAVAVAIHTLSDNLEEDVVENKYVTMLRFLLEVFAIWYLWQGCMWLTNIGNILTANDLNFTHYLVVFGTMCFLLLFVKCSQEESFLVAGLILLLGRALAVLAALVEVMMTPCPAWISAIRHDNLKRFSSAFAISSLIELCPLVVALLWSCRLDRESIANAVGWGMFTTMLTTILLRTGFSYLHRSDGKDEFLDVAHIQERYSLITFILLGELCFAAASATGVYFESMSSFATAVGCFLLYFAARVDGRTEAWQLGNQARTLCNHLHLVLFCVIPFMGVFFARLMHDAHSTEQTDSPWYQDPDVILGFFSGIFLITLALLELITEDPNNRKPKMQKAARVWLCALVGLLVVLVTSLFYHAAVIVPLSYVLTSSLLLWGTSIIKY